MVSVNRDGFSRGLSPWLADGHHLTVSPPGLFSVHTHFWCVSLLTKTLFLLDQGPTLCPHLALVTFLQVLSPNTVALGFRAS